MTTFKDQLNAANPQELADLLRDLKLGDFLRAMPISLAKQAPVPGALANYNLTTIDVLPLPADAKAAFVLRASVRAGSTTGELKAADPHYGDTPATTEFAITPCGDIAFDTGTDNVTDADILYVPAKGEVVEFEGTLATGVLSLPSAWTARGVMMLLEAEITAGTVTGKKTILVPLAGGGAGLPATTKAQLTSNKTTASFNNATDAGTTARVKCLIAPSLDSSAKMSADATY